MKHKSHSHCEEAVGRRSNPRPARLLRPFAALAEGRSFGIGARNDTNALLRGLDANFNRAKEALRVLEDISRFCLENRHLTAKLKRLRHGLTQILFKFPVSYRNWLEARDAAHDIGKDNPVQDSSKRDVCALWISNMKRAQEALRVLEEFSKAVQGPRVSGFEKIRFSLYELEKKSFRLF